MIVGKSCRVATVAAAMSLIAIAGCSGEKSDDTKVRGVVTGFFSDFADGQGAAACDALTGGAIRFASVLALTANAPATCPDAVMVVHGQLTAEERQALKKVQVNRTTINGDQATIAPTDIEFDFNGQSSLMSTVKAGPTRLVKVGGTWKIDSLG